MEVLDDLVNLLLDYGAQLDLPPCLVRECFEDPITYWPY